MSVRMWQTPDQPGDACACLAAVGAFGGLLLYCVLQPWLLLVVSKSTLLALSVPFALSLFVTQVLLWFAWETVVASLSSCLLLLLMLQ